MPSKKSTNINITVNQKMFDILVNLNKEVDILCQAIMEVNRKGDTHWNDVFKSMERLTDIQPTPDELSGISGELNSSVFPNSSQTFVQWSFEKEMELREQLKDVTRAWINEGHVCIHCGTKTVKNEYVKDLGGGYGQFVEEYICPKCNFTISVNGSEK